MIRTLGPTFLRRPHGAEWVADVLRLVAVLGVPVAAIGWGGIAVAVLLLSLLAVVVPRMLGVRPGLDIAACVLSLVAAWSSVLSLYTTVFLWDKVMHVSFIAALAALALVIGSDLGVVPAPRDAPLAVSVVVSGTAGLALGAVWEMLEFLGHTYLASSIRVGYADTIGDLAADLAGAVAVGFLARWITGERRVVLRRPISPGADRGA